MTLVMRCSKLARPMVCAGYSFLKLHQTEGGPAAKEGTACGEYLQHLLEGTLVPHSATNGIFFDDDMRYHAKPIAQDMVNRATDKILCEQRIDWMTRSGVMIKGSYDAAFIDDRDYLCVEDLKYGYNIVEAPENWQLLGYAIGEVIRRGRSFTHISIKIHQPRAHHEDGPTREWLITYAELLEYKEKIEVRMQSLVDGERSLTTSSACKYCEGAAEACPAFSRLFYRALEVSTEFHQDSLTDAEVSEQLDHVKRAVEVIKIKGDSLEELAISRIKNGKIIPNYIQTKKYGNRVWKGGITPESLKIMTGKDCNEVKFLTPAKVEKLGVPRKLVSQLTDKKFMGIKLVKKDSTKIGNEIFGTANPNGGK